MQADKPKKMDIVDRPAAWPLQLKVLLTMVVIMMAIGLGGAVGQIIVHDVIPTFWGEQGRWSGQVDQKPENTSPRGDLFASMPQQKELKPFYKTDKFIFALKFTHIHLFGMSAIFILMGAVVAFLDLSVRLRIWLIVLPFIGVLIDLASVWLKLFIHPAFFWLHIPGGGLFGIVFAVDAVTALRQIWDRKI